MATSRSRSADGDYAVTVNGELYGYKRIRTQLACESLPCSGKSDSAITLPLYFETGFHLSINCEANLRSYL